MSGAGPETADLSGLWPHQREAVRAAAAHLARGERCQVIMACGTGKTRAGAATSRWVAPAGKVLVVVPTQELLAQTARVWAEHLGAGAGMIGAVCAEPGATADADEVRGQMAHLHAGVSTDPADVAGWLRAPGRATVFTTYASLPAVAAAHDMPRVPGWDLAVVDEAHRAAGPVGRLWSLINDDAAIPAGRRLYMTATPRVMPGDRDDIVSMDDEKVFGPEVFRVSFAQAIGQGLLADYRVAVAVVTGAEVAKLAAGEAVVSPAGAAVPARMLAAQLALLKAAAQHDLGRIITYHQRVAGARRFARTLPHAAALLPPGEGPRLVHAGSVDGSMRLAERREILWPLRAPGNQTVVVSNSRVLSEGVDVPELDAVMFADPRDSGTDVVQVVGRALRLGSRKSKTATIIIPVLLNEAEAPEAALESSEFATVWRVVRALRAHDERMAEWLDQQRITQARHGNREHGPDPQAPGWLSVTGTAADASFAAALQVRIVDAGSSPWLEGYARAAAWHAEHGHLVISSKHVTSDGYPLGRWVHQQREYRKRGILPAGRITRLDAVAMVWDMREVAWMEGLSRLRAWHAAHGHLAIPTGYQDSDGFRLGAWVSDLRRRRAPLSSEKIAALDALGMAWDMADYRWQTGLAAARAYHAAHGHINAPYGYITPGGLRLDQWIAGGRRAGDHAEHRPRMDTRPESRPGLSRRAWPHQRP
jgi:superfamily II DNA or RNA helicase